MKLVFMNFCFFFTIKPQWLSDFASNIGHVAIAVAQVQSVFLKSVYLHIIFLQMETRPCTFNITQKT